MIIDPLLKDVSRPAQVDDDVLALELGEPATALAALLREIAKSERRIRPSSRTHRGLASAGVADRLPPSA